MTFEPAPADEPAGEGEEAIVDFVEKLELLRDVVAVGRGQRPGERQPATV